MKTMRWLVGLAMVAAVVVVADPVNPGGFTVGTSAVTVCPDRTVQYGVPFSTNMTNVVGDVVQQGSTIWPQTASLFWCVQAGISSNAVVTLSAVADTASGSAVYRPMRGKRLGLAIVNRSTNQVFVAVGQTATNGCGICLYPNGGAWDSEGAGCPQWKVSVVAGGAGSAVSVLEW